MATLYLGGTLSSMWMWSGIALPSTIEFQVSRFLSRSGFGIISMMWCPRKLTQGQIEERRLEGGRLLRAGRLTHAEIARRLGISLRAVRQWAKQLRDHPSSGLRALRSRHRPGRPSRLSAAQWHSILKTLRKGALKAGFETDRWTLRRISDLIRMAVPEALTRFPQSILGLLPGLG
jgi:transposase